MGSVYSIYSQMKFKDKNKAIKILQAKISRGKEEHTDYGLDTYRKSENLDINDIDDLVAVFIGIGRMFDVANDDNGWTTYSNGFDATYGWESVMMEMFEELAPVLEDGSDLSLIVMMEPMCWLLKMENVFKRNEVMR